MAECWFFEIQWFQRQQHCHHSGEALYSTVWLAPAEILVYVKLLSELPPNEQRTWTGTKQVSALTQSTGHKNPEYSTRDPPVINPKQKGENKATQKKRTYSNERANKCRDRHSTKSHAGDPKFYVAQAQAKHEHDPCQQPNEKWPTQTEPRELHPVEAGYPCYKVDKDMSTQCGQKCQCRDNLAKCKCHQHQKIWALWKAAGEKQPPVATARASGPEAANFRTPSEHHPNQFYEKHHCQNNQDPDRDDLIGNAYEGTKHAKHCGSHTAEHRITRRDVALSISIFSHSNSTAITAEKHCMIGTSRNHSTPDIMWKHWSLVVPASRN